MQNQFNKTSVLNVKQFQKISKKLKQIFYKFKDIQRLEFLFQIQGHSRTFKFCTNPVNNSLTLESSGFRKFGGFLGFLPYV